MPAIPPDLRDGDELVLNDINAMLQEHRRWQKIRGVGQVRILNAQGSSPPIIEGMFPVPMLIRLTSNGDANALHSWEEFIWDPDHTGGAAYVSTLNKADGTDIIDQAREINGLKCPASDALLWAWRNKRGELTFTAIRYRGKADADIAASASGTVSVWASQSGTVVDTTLNVTALNWNSLTKVTSGHRVMITPCEGVWNIDYEEC